MKQRKWLPFIALLFCISGAFAQNMQPHGNDNRELLRMGLYPPDVIMRQQERLGITKDQRKEIAALVREFQGQITELQWNLRSEQQKLHSMLNEERVEAATALAQVTQVLNMESEFKIAHFELLIAIKNELTSVQIEQLDSVIRRRLSEPR
ncbi:MAG: Spy/CpxP family protein refolding chaperone [Bacteroidia bacterium]|jgi:Spy/CpxP family protein refolding chaperone